MKTATASVTSMGLAPRTTGLKARTWEIVLGKDEVHGWDASTRGLLLEAREGTVWLTQSGDGADVILSRGDRFRVNRSGRIVVQSLSPRTRLVAHS